ncbi:hypothetical protein B0T21DRAFT_375174 [Apiosordaria backusii]|uniref:Uncharacterized protein n=1 Tax=Apiosordaria backusii TaxID=314023 RepID=A0AA40DYU5_9PEZI|nr:hypothetical protein B0T21DRAFT_375174 [Apiosordaria backusii]
MQRRQSSRGHTEPPLDLRKTSVPLGKSPLEVHPQPAAAPRHHSQLNAALQRQKTQDPFDQIALLRSCQR